MVYCDQKTDGGGWTVIHHKGITNSSLWEQYDALIDDPDKPNQYQANWSQNMKAYKNGFGWVSCNGESDYWMGLDYMNALTRNHYSGNAKLRIDIKDWDNRDYWGYYNKFMVMEENRGYQLIARDYDGIGSYSIGDAWDGMAFGGEPKQKVYTKSNTMRFSTKDVDNDKFCKYTRTRRNNYGMELPVFNADDKAAQCEAAAVAAGHDWKTDKTLAAWGSCAGQDGSGFWYNRCSAGNLNGKVYYNGQDGYYALKELSIENEFTHEAIMRDHDDGLIWGTLNKGRDYSFMSAEMRVRPKNFVTKAGEITRTRLNGTPMEDDRAKDNSNNNGRRG
jgi:integrin beta 3